MSIDSNDILPYVVFNGRTSRELGHEHGAQLADRIDRAIHIYREQFSKQKQLNEKAILNLCEQYDRGIALFSTEYQDELQSIALASKQDILWIVALNCRLEILNHLAFGMQNECTVLYDACQCQLAENWDWIQAFEHLAFINYIESKAILQMTEPGVLSKIGLNSSGIGVTINFVDPPYRSVTPSNIPLHISIRAVLDQAHSLNEAVNIFRRNGPGFGGHVLVGRLIDISIVLLYVDMNRTMID
jgi:isopenicillin-N N-acyltransferase like protein